DPEDGEDASAQGLEGLVGAGGGAEAAAAQRGRGGATSRHPADLGDGRDPLYDLLVARPAKRRELELAHAISKRGDGRLRLDQIAERVVDVDHFEDSRPAAVTRAVASPAAL